MADSRKKYLNVDVIAFLEDKMKSNTEHYQSDFELDKETIERCALSERKEDKCLLWMSRRNGTQCNKEHDVFVKDSAAHTTWMYFGNQEYDENSVGAYLVEIFGKFDGVIVGNVYELNFADLIKDIKDLSVEPLEYMKTFKDGFVVNVPFERSSSVFYHDLVEKHGAIVDSLAIPLNNSTLNFVLLKQHEKREKLGLFDVSSPQECADLFGKPVMDGENLYWPDEKHKSLLEQIKAAEPEGKEVLSKNVELER